MKNKNIFYSKENFKTKCIQYKSIKDVNEMSSGGKIISFNDEKIMLTVGDFWQGSIAQNLEEPYGKTLLLNKKNSGHGPTITYGYKTALGLKPEFIFQVDSDDQFNTSDFKKFWKNRYNYDFIIGHRLIRNDPFHRLIVTRFLKLLILDLRSKIFMIFL